MSHPSMPTRPALAGAGVFFSPAAGGGRSAGPGRPVSPGGTVGLAAAPRAADAADARHLLGLEGMSRDALLGWLAAAAEWRTRLAAPRFAADTLRGVAVCNAFFEDSTRTRVSFEVAERRLGAAAVTFAAAGSSLSKGESLLDTARTIAAMGVDLLVVRHGSPGAPALIARHVEVGVINAGDGEHEHPTQGLLDLLTLADAWGGRFEGRRIAIVGDVAHSRVARSALFGLTALGARVTFAGPPTLMPAGLEALGAEVAGTVEEALAGADAAMALRLQRERMESGLVPSVGEYARVWGLDARRAGQLAPGAPVLHPGPMNREVEISSEVADGPRSAVLRQVANGVAVRCAVLERCATARSRIG